MNFVWVCCTEDLSEGVTLDCIVELENSVGGPDWGGEFALLGVWLPEYRHAGREEGDTVVQNVANRKFPKFGNRCYCCTCSHTQFTLCSAMTVICKEIVPQFCCCQFPP